MKIAYIMSHRELNGVTASGTAQLRGLLARGHEVHLVHRPGAWIGEQRFDGDLHRHAVDMGRRLPSPATLNPVRQSLARAGVQIGYSHGTQANVVSALWRAQGLCPMLAKAAARIWHLHWRLQDGVIAPSQYTADWFLQKRLVSPARLHVVPNFVRVQDVVEATPGTRARARAALGLPEDALAVTIIGKVDARKNQAAILPVIEGLRARGLDARAVIVGQAGGGYAETLRARIADRGLADHVTLLGHRADARELLPAFDALVCTSHDEQGPVAVIEAMAACIPAVSTPVGMVPTLVEPGRNGTILNLGDPASVIDYLAGLAVSAEHRMAQGAAARATFAEKLSEGRIIDRLEEVFARYARG